MLDRSNNPHQPAEPGAVEGAAAGNVDRVLFKNLVEMVPLVESLMVSAAGGRPQISPLGSRGISFSRSARVVRCLTSVCLCFLVPGCSKIGG
jgi:hypothetical protein